MFSSTPGIHLQDIEKQLIDNGGFHLIDYLLDQGWLRFDDYEAWRRNELPVLESCIALPAETLDAWLKQVESQALRLKLVAQPQVFYSWQGDPPRELILSRHDELARRLAQSWVREDNLPQLDMFMDSAATATENDLLSSLNSRQWNKAETDCGRLGRQVPHHPRLAHYEMLIAYGIHASAGAPPDEPARLGEELDKLEKDITPLVRELLRDRARDFLGPAWQRLAQALRGLPFDPDHPKRHASFAWAQLPHWPNVVAAVMEESAYAEHFVLLRRLAEAHYYSRSPEKALLIWCRLFEMDVQAAVSTVENTSLPLLRQLWNEFSDREPAIPTELFSAWLMLHAPGLAAASSNSQLSLPQGVAFTAARALMQARRERKDEISARKQLKEISPALLRDYLDNV